MPNTSSGEQHAPLNQPSYAAQVFTVAVSVLNLWPTYTLEDDTRDNAIRTGLRTIVTPLPEAVRADVNRIVWTGLPDVSPNETHGEYALRLRDAAKDL